MRVDDARIVLALASMSSVTADLDHLEASVSVAC